MSKSNETSKLNPIGPRAREGATVVITHRLRNNLQAEYDEWIDKIKPIAMDAPGFLDTNVVRPIHGLTETCTIIMRFDSEENLRKWMESPTRSRLIEEVRPLLATDDDFFINSGLDFWFTPAGAKAKVPLRWKQYLMTWSVIYPLVLVIPLIITPVLEFLGVPSNRFLTTLAITGSIVFLLVYLIMPRYTRLLQRWLFR